MSNRKLRVGLIGAGNISEIHCKGWKLLPDVELVAVTDANFEAAAKKAAEHNIASVEESAEALIARDDIDAVDILVPNRFHKPYTVAALQSGKHVLCEKPLALTVAEVDEMIAAADKADKKLMCAQMLRFQTDSIAMKEYLTRRPLGQVYYARAWFNRRRLLPCTPGFMYKRNSGGGCCIDVGVHVLDLALHLMDNFSPTSVSGTAGTMLARHVDAWSEWGTIDKIGIDVEDFAAALVRFANGATLTLECSFMLNMKAHTENRISLFGTEAGAVWPDMEYFEHTANGYVDTKIATRPSTQQPHFEEIAQFASCVLNDTPVPVPPQQSRAVIAILEGLYRSQEAGKEVIIS